MDLAESIFIGTEPLVSPLAQEISQRSRPLDSRVYLTAVKTKNLRVRDHIEAKDKVEYNSPLQQKVSSSR